MAVLYLIPVINWFATQGAINALHPSRAMWLAMTSANAVCLLLLFFADVGTAVARRPALAPAGARVLIHSELIPAPGSPAVRRTPSDMPVIS